MTVLAITGAGLLTSAGMGLEALSARLRSGVLVGAGAVEAAGCFDDPMPTPTAHLVPDLDVRARLGRKGTSTFDRATGMAVIAAGLALEDGGLALADADPERVGIALGTTAGSLRSTIDFSRDTIEQERPYFVNPSLFPNTVMNCAAGQTAIWYGTRGVNATVAGGRLSMVSVLRYARNLLRRDAVDTVLAGAVEELTPHSAWAVARTTADENAVPGEAAGVLVVERPEEAQAHGRHVDLEVLSVVAGYVPTSADPADGLTRCIDGVLGEAGLPADEVALVVTQGTALSTYDAVEARALASAFRGRLPDGLGVAQATGECGAATGVVQAAAVLALHRGDPSRDGQVSLLTAWTADGTVGAALVRGWSRVGSSGR